MSHFEFRVLLALLALGIDWIGAVRVRWQDRRYKETLDKERREGKYHLNLGELIGGGTVAPLLGFRIDWGVTVDDLADWGGHRGHWGVTVDRGAH